MKVTKADSRKLRSLNLRLFKLGRRFNGRDGHIAWRLAEARLHVTWILVNHGQQETQR